jgi:hypothetical protein
MLVAIFLTRSYAAVGKLQQQPSRNYVSDQLEVTLRIDCICAKCSAFTSPQLHGRPNTSWSATSFTISGFPSLRCQLFCMFIQINPDLV